MFTAAERQRRYRERHKHDPAFRVRVHAEKRRSYQRTQTKCLARSQRWADAHRERVRAIARAHYANHLEAQRERSRNKRPEATRAAWRKSYYGHHVHGKALKLRAENTRRARKRGALCEVIDYDAVIAAARGQCGICAQPIGTERTHFDHVVPLANGGSHTQANLQLAHAICNIRKGARSQAAA